LRDPLQNAADPLVIGQKQRRGQRKLGDEWGRVAVFCAAKHGYACVSSRRVLLRKTQPHFHYFRPLRPAFLGLAFLEGAGFCPADLPRLPPKALSHPSAYFEFVPTRVIVTAYSSPSVKLFQVSIQT
jgi:hypothetical protein